MTLQSEARKSFNYWAQMRQNMALMYRAGVPESTRDAVRSELEHILDSSILIYPQTLLALGIHDGLTYAESKEVLGVKQTRQQLTENQEKFLDAMADKAVIARKMDWQWRVAQEHEDKTAQGWYPFFITLTVDPKVADPKDVWQDSKPLRQYIRSL